MSILTDLYDSWEGDVADRQARNRDPLAPARIQVVLEMEKADQFRGDRRFHSANQPDQTRWPAEKPSFWGAPRKSTASYSSLGLNISESTILRISTQESRRIGGQTWKTFSRTTRRNRLPGLLCCTNHDLQAASRFGRSVP